MAMGREGDRQDDLIVTWAEMPRSPGHVFYDRLQKVLIAGGYDLFVETACQPYYAPKMGRAVSAAGALFPGAHGRLFRGHRQRARHRLAVFGSSMSLRDFLCDWRAGRRFLDHSWLSKTRGGRLPHEVHESAFGWCCSSWPSKETWSRASVDRRRRLDHGGQCRAGATIVRRSDMSTYREMLTAGYWPRRSGIDTPECGRSGSARPRPARARSCRTKSMDEQRPIQSAKIAKMKDGRTHLAYKAEHVVDLDTWRRRRGAHCVRPIKATQRRSRAR